MNLLLDSHTLLWWDENKLSARLVSRISQADLVFVSAATVWELAIKGMRPRNIGQRGFAGFVASRGFNELPISFEHAEAVRQLPNHHRDPFDRLLIAQAFVEGLTLVSKDGRFADYGVKLLWE